MQLIVLGMHRSGTSSVTRLLNLAGAHFGPEGIATEPNDENPKGFWERRDVREVCDGLLLGGGFDWWRVAGFDLGLIPEAVRDERLAEFRGIVHKLDAHRPWVIKEPRLCLLTPILRPALEAPVFVHVTREPLEIAESLSARNGFPIPVGLALWETYVRHARAAAADDPGVVVSYGQLLQDPIATTARLVEELTELGVAGLRTPTEREVTAFITPDLHRQRRSADDRRALLNEMQAELATEIDDGHLLGGPAVVELSAGAVATLQAFEAHQAVATDASVLRTDLERERARADADRAAAAAHLERAEAEAVEQRARLDQARTELTTTRRELDELRADARAELAARRRAEREALEATSAAAKRVRAAKASGTMRLARRVAMLRAGLGQRRQLGVDAALQGALREIERATSVLQESDSTSQQDPTNPPEEPPPVEELRHRRQSARARGDRPKVAVVAWDVGHNPFGRAHLLADVLRARFDVELWGTQFERYGTDVWPPLRDTDIPIRRVPGRSFPEHLDTMDDMARRMDVDAIYVSKPRLPSLGAGVLAKELWNRPLIVDIDDFEPSFFDESEGIEPDLLAGHLDDPDVLLPFGRLWTRACESVVRGADLITVSNPELEARYGGIVVPHVRDESAFDPARVDRAAVRQRLGLADEDRLVLFGGTPRAHKGIFELLEAVERLGDDHIRVGVFATRELDDLRRQIGPLERWILSLPYHSFAELPELLAAADLTCALQSPDHPVSRYQMPAKVTDAIAMGLPCLVTPVPPLQPLIDKDVVEVFDGDVPLHQRLREVLRHDEETADRARRARELFLASYSYAAVRPVLDAAIGSLLDAPPPLAPELATLTSTARRLFRPASEPVPSEAARRRPIPPGSTYDLVVLWKQNDTGIYGRRQDMFLKYLERSGRFGNILHLDQPISLEALLHLARRGIGAPDQNRLVLAQTLRRLAHRADHGATRHRTYLYAAGRTSRSLRLPPRDHYPRYVRALLQREGFGRRPLMVWVYPSNPTAPQLLDALEPDVVVADVVDDNRTWYEPGSAGFEQVDRNYAEILARSDLVLANCEAVGTSMQAFTPCVHVVPNACELPEPGRVARPRPDSLAGLQAPIIGYAGNLSDRIDIALLRAVARARRDWNLVLMGSAHLDRAALALDEEPNIRFLGTKRYDDALEIIEHFDVGLIPHLDNEMTRSMNPLKAYVYCSLGVPVVSTPVANIGEMSRFITVAEGPQEYIAAIERALAAGRHAPDADALRPHSWDERAERVLGLVDDVVSSRHTDD